MDCTYFLRISCFTYIMVMTNDDSFSSRPITLRIGMRMVEINHLLTWQKMKYSILQNIPHETSQVQGTYVSNDSGRWQKLTVFHSVCNIFFSVICPVFQRIVINCNIYVFGCLNESSNSNPSVTRSHQTKWIIIAYELNGSHDLCSNLQPTFGQKLY